MTALSVTPPLRARVWQVINRDPLLIAGIGLFLLLLAFSLLGPLLVDTGMAAIGAVPARRPPSPAHWLGTDGQGRDMVAALIVGLPQSLRISLFAGVLGLLIGIVLGLMAAYFHGWVDVVIRTLSDVVMTIPGIAVLVLVATNVRIMTVDLIGLIVASIAWMYPTRTIRSQTLSIISRPYIDVARVNAVGGLRLLATEVLPNLLPFIAASFVTGVSSALLATIGLEALGLGPQNELTLGGIIYWAQYNGAILRGMWWWWLPPVVLIALIFLSLLMTSIGLDRIVNNRLSAAP
jgi:peptide/nickel transport system permease protein